MICDLIELMANPSSTASLYTSSNRCSGMGMHDGTMSSPLSASSVARYYGFLIHVLCCGQNPIFLLRVFSSSFFKELKCHIVRDAIPLDANRIRWSIFTMKANPLEYVKSIFMKLLQSFKTSCSLDSLYGLV